MLYNGKAKAGSACFAGPAFIDSVESFKDSLLLVFGNADAGVLYRKERVIILLTGLYQDGSVFTIVLDGILDEVFHELLQEIPISGEYSGIPFTGKRKVAGLGADREISATFLCQGLQIYRCKFPGKFFVVEFRQSNDIVDQRQKTVRIMSDLFSYMGYLIPGFPFVLKANQCSDDIFEINRVSMPWDTTITMAG